MSKSTGQNGMKKAEVTREAAEPEVFEFSRAAWMKLYLEGKHGMLVAEMLKGFKHYAFCTYWNLRPASRSRINEFVENFLYFFCTDEFQIPQASYQLLLDLHPVITNLVAMSDFDTTTAWVRRLARKRESFFKLLALHNVRTDLPLDASILFETSPLHASKWWAFFWMDAAAFCSKATYDRIREHIDSLNDEFLIFGEHARASYFPVTYVAPEQETAVKKRINDLAKKAFSNISIVNKPEKRKVALVSGRWFRSAVYTSMAPLIHSLKGRYDITLINLGTDPQRLLDKDLFERRIDITFENNTMNLEALQANPFCALIYPDIGMNSESVFLSNIRIAPVQIAMYGHPASTRYSEIDYFIGGSRVEDAAKAAENYSERLVLLPGLGAYPVFPAPEDMPANFDPITEPMAINCAWTAQKVVYPLLETLTRVRARSSRPLKFHFFPGGAFNQNRYIPFVKDIHSVLGAENVAVFPKQSFADYLAGVSRGAFSIDSYPFGGFNTVIDALSCRKPIVVWEGDRAFNRFGAATLEIVGLPELIARSEQEYLEKVVRLVNDDGHRRTLYEKVAAIDLKAAFSGHLNPDYFRKAIDYLIGNHDRLKEDRSKGPIYIE